MPEQPRNRDCIILKKGGAIPVSITDVLARGGWQGGQGCQWAGSNKDELLVTYSDGLYAGFLLWGSNETADKFTAMTMNQPVYHQAVIGVGGWMISTVSYEKYTWNSRNGIGPPGVLIDYHASDRLLFSLRGYWTKEDEWTLALDPRRPNAYFIGFVSQAPSPVTKDYMTVQVSL